MNLLSGLILKSLERTHFFPPFPPEVNIENTNVCNAECVMCPREKLTRPYGFMDFSLFEKIVKEISRRRFTTKSIHFHNFGEPLLDKLLPARIRLAKKYGIQHTYFVGCHHKLDCASFGKRRCGDQIRNRRGTIRITYTDS